LYGPGRIDRKLELKHLQPAQAMEMAEHFFDCKLNRRQQKDLTDIIEIFRLKITPAEFETVSGCPAVEPV
jgi:hypothetical protein